jgi:hypothetical protein
MPFVLPKQRAWPAPVERSTAQLPAPTVVRQVGNFTEVSVSARSNLQIASFESGTCRLGRELTRLLSDTQKHITHNVVHNCNRTFRHCQMRMNLLQHSINVCCIRIVLFLLVRIWLRNSSSSSNNGTLSHLKNSTFFLLRLLCVCPKCQRKPRVCM